MDFNVTDDALSRDVYVRQRYMQSVQSNIKKFNDEIAEGFELALRPSTYERMHDLNFVIVAFERENGTIHDAPVEVLPWCRAIAIILHDGVPLLNYRVKCGKKCRAKCSLEDALVNDLLDKWVFENAVVQM